MNVEPAGARYLEEETALPLLRAAVRHVGACLRSTSLRSVHVRSGRSVSHVYDAVLAFDGEQQHVLLVAHADTRPLPKGAFELERDGARVAVWRFPFDPYLPGLPSAIDPTRVRELLDRLRAPAGRVTLHTRAYRPSRRAVVEVSIDSGDLAGRILYLKILAGERATELADIHRRLSPHVRVPGVVGVSEAQGILALEALEGRTLRTALIDDDEVPDPDHVVELSRRFASSGLRTRRDPRASADPTRHVPLLRSLVPAKRADIERVAIEAADVDGPLVAVHGDLHDGQLLLRGRELTGVLDVDGAGAGLIAQDAGNLIAHVQAIGELWPAAADRCEVFAARLHKAYTGLVDRETLARTIAGAWLALATGPHRAQAPDHLAATQRWIERACRALDGDAVR